MAWVKPCNSRKRVDAAGAALAHAVPSESEWAVIGNWRSSHSYPLNVVKGTLLNRARAIDAKALVAQRLKRVRSIRAKLCANASMAFSQMQDVAGCRAILRNPDLLRALVAQYDESHQTRRKDRPAFHEKYDYLERPKADGYRGVHFVYKYFSRAQGHESWNNLRVEIQLRTRLQHAWATAVEVAETFTGQALRSNVGPEAWTRFFSLMSNEVAYRERMNLVPGMPTVPKDWRAELRDITGRLNVEATLDGWRHLLSATPSLPGEAEYFLLDLNPEMPSLVVTSFTKRQLPEAETAYLEKEKIIQGTNNLAVLVAVDSIKTLQKAYPNYYLDTSAFLRVMRRAVSLPSLTGQLSLPAPIGEPSNR